MSSESFPEILQFLGGLEKKHGAEDVAYGLCAMIAYAAIKAVEDNRALNEDDVIIFFCEGARKIINGYKKRINKPMAH